MKVIEAAREQVIERGNPATGLPWGDVCARGIRSGQWDRGKYVQDALAKLEADGISEEDDNG